SGKQRPLKPICRQTRNEPAEGTKKNDKPLIFVIKHNAALRGECRLNQVSADHFHHKSHRKLKMPRGMNPA
ncbi:hypothetical protein ACSTDX_21785, partial [Vibrio vulnificus]|uniref:hypothetical protein n=1 Tax=Vibrio vulnificus TaxID=672 RepID=UPI003EDB1DE7